MTETIVVPSPQARARVAGFLYLIVIVTAFFAEMVVRSRMIMPDDPAGTARSIMMSQTLYRLGGVADLVNLACDVALSILLYDLLKPVNRTIALIAAAFRLIADACLIGASLFHYVPIYFLDSTVGLRSFNLAQTQALALVAARIHDLGYNISLVFFAIHCVLLGGLIMRSRFLPSVIGSLFVVTGICYIINSLVHLVWPTLDIPIYFLLTGLISESALMIWLILFGVDVPKWREAMRNMQ